MSKARRTRRSLTEEFNAHVQQMEAAAERINLHIQACQKIMGLLDQDAADTEAELNHIISGE